MTRSIVGVAMAIALATGAEAGEIPGLRVLSIDASGVSLEYHFGELSLDPVTTSDGPMTRVRIPGFGTLSAAGLPALPTTGIWVALPPTGAYTLRILEEETEAMPGVGVTPVERVGPEDGSAGGPAGEDAGIELARLAGKPYPMAPAVLEDETWMRFQRVAALRLHPVRYVSATRTLLVTRRLVLRVEFDAADPAAPQTLERVGLEPAPAPDGYFEELYRGALINDVQARRFRARPRMTRGPVRSLSSSGTGNPEWRVRIDTTGVWRVRFDQLQARGWPAGVPVASITASLRDTTPGLAPIPWTAVEIPIDVTDANGNSLFDEGDFIVLPVRTWAQRMSPTWYERRHGDAEVVWLSYLSAGAGLRVATRPGWLGASDPAVPASFISTRRYERNLDYDSVPLDVTLVDQFLWTVPGQDASPIDLDADLLDLDTGGADITVTAEWVGRQSLQHLVSASWVSGAGTTPLWTNQSFSGKNAYDIQRAFDASLASPGVNRLRISGSSSSVGSRASLNWFDVAYPRFYVARNNHLEFNSAGATDTVEFRIDGFAAAERPAVYAYDVTDWDAPVRLPIDSSQVMIQEGAWRVLLQDLIPASTTRSYAIATEIPTVTNDAVEADVGSSLYLTASEDAELVIIARDDFAPAMEPLADLRRSQGVGTLLAKSQDVYDEFNGGRRSHFAIRRFLRYAFDHWNTRYVLLVGDASEDPQGWLGTADVDYLPTPVIPSPVGVFDGFSMVYEVVPSDNWYVFGLAGPPGPGQDLLADMLIGRWTAGSIGEAQALVEKTIAHEAAAEELWQVRVVLISDDTYSTSTFGGGGSPYCPQPSEAVFEDISHNVDTIIRQEGGYSNYDVRRFDLAEHLSALPLVPGCADYTRESLMGAQQYTRFNVSPMLLQLLGEGAAFVNFQGHGNAHALTHENLYLSSGAEQDIDQISNTGRPWIFTGFSSHLNNYAGVREGSGVIGDGLGERMVNAAGKGAIASFASTAYEVLPLSPGSHLNEHVYRAIFVDPPPVSATGRIALGEALALGVARMVASSSFSLERRAARTYVLLGDPLLGLDLSRTVDVPDSRTALAPSLEFVHPNPGWGSTRIGFSLPSPARRARLGVYDVGGRLIRVVLDKALAAGNHEALWDGKQENGQAALPGVYFCRLDLDGSEGRQTLVRRLVRLR